MALANVVTLVLIQFEKTYVQDFRNAIISSLSILKSYSGVCLGVGEELNEDEGEWFRFRAIAVFEFPNSIDAEKWTANDPCVRAMDLKYNADIIILPAKRKGIVHSYLQIMDVKLAEKKRLDEFDQNYAAGHLSSLAGHGQQLVATTSGRKHKGTWDVNKVIFVVNMFPEKQHYDQWFYGEEYSKLREVRNQMAACRVISFPLTPLCFKKILPKSLDPYGGLFQNREHY